MNEEVLDFNKKYQTGIIETCYIGGGNPSINPDDINEINNILNKHFDLNGIKEYTVECNPLNITREFIKKIEKTKINRVSLGIQSFSEKALNAANRNQNNKTVNESLKMLYDHFDNLSIDLINGLAYSDIKKEIDGLHEIVSKYKINHISFYELMIGEKCKFGKMKLPFLSEEEKYSYEKVFGEMIKVHGFYKYEISNYAKKGYESIHNKAYWNYKNYAGFGPGAHSTIDGFRIENKDDVKSYMDGNYKKTVELSYKERIEEYILMGLRLVEGIDLKDFYERFDCHLDNVINFKSIKYSEKLEIKNNNLTLTDSGFNLMNRVLVDIFEDLDESI